MISQRNKDVGGKQKNGLAADGRNRRVLRDIGNLVKDADGGKPQLQINRPMTRGLCKQLVAKGQPVAEKNAKIAGKNTKRVLQEIDNGVAVRRKGASVVDVAAVQKKQCEIPKPKEVVIVSSDDGSKLEISRRKSRPASSKKTAKAFTSILSARSKVACGLVNRSKNVTNIDATDVDDELAAVEYVEDIYKFYKLTEVDGRVHDYMVSQNDINSKMRAILIDWLIEVHRKFELVPESLYLTINIVDRYLSMEIVPRRELQLVGVSSMLIACKYEEIWAPEVNDLIAISDNAYSREQVLLMEKSILGKLEWYLTVPTPYVFLVRYIKSSVPSDPEMENMVFFLAELGLMHYSVIVMYTQSIIAASAVYAARCTLNKCPFWTETLKHYTGYSEAQLRDCAKQLVSYHAALPEMSRNVLDQGDGDALTDVYSVF
ncbi:G2/mitotic-specific cyclin-2 like [Heracleum sosnowskyi]|uniref:G2/mitotic-specific cyclin-2 like n=1 Tax=Heracleum sosnowskyi TaxID=360622 RepID=A0AAD8MHD3_9APIA|nr:G2/mitotic-specific cyclin-2 like [Heracleum sosnowskyi]